MSGKAITLAALVLGGTLLLALGFANPDVSPDDIVGVLLTRFAWLGAIVASLLWIVALQRIWRVEGSLHHLVARTLSVVVMLALSGAVIVIFWPYVLESPIRLTVDQIRIVVAFIVGMSIMAAIWQLTAPPQARVPRDGKRYP